MIAMTIHLHGDGVWPDLAQRPLLKAVTLGVAALDAGMQSGLPSVTFRLDTEDGQVVVGETSMRLFLQAAAAFRARFGDVDRL